LDADIAGRRTGGHAVASEVSMSVDAIIVLVIVLIVVAAAILVGVRVMPALGLRRRFGPEYDRLARQVGPRRAQAELAERRRRVAQLGIHALTAEQRVKYASQWTATQEQFIDDPTRSTRAAAGLVTAAAADCGYPADDHAQLLTDLSVHYARRLDAYRRARQTTEHAASAATEELRQAMLGFRGLFRELLGPRASTAVQPPRSVAARGAGLARTGTGRMLTKTTKE
jgi:hypothetical protein